VLEITVPLSQDQRRARRIDVEEGKRASGAR
jgi:hypothetical protein